MAIRCRSDGILRGRSRSFAVVAERPVSAMTPCDVRGPVVFFAFLRLALTRASVLTLPRLPLPSLGGAMLGLVPGSADQPTASRQAGARRGRPRNPEAHVGIGWTSIPWR